MPARSVDFEDPDHHSLELCAWSEWRGLVAGEFKIVSTVPDGKPVGTRPLNIEESDGGGIHATL